jgi:hypothetical protein
MERPRGGHFRSQSLVMSLVNAPDLLSFESTVLSKEKGTCGNKINVGVAVQMFLSTK